MQEKQNMIEGIDPNFILNNDMENNSSFIEGSMLDASNDEMSKYPLDEKHNPNDSNDSGIMPSSSSHHNKMLCEHKLGSVYSDERNFVWRDSKETKMQESLKSKEESWKEEAGQEIHRRNTTRTNKNSVFSKCVSKNDIFKEVIIENANIMNHKINDKINELLNNVLHLYDASLKRQYLSRIFRIRDIHCIFVCAFCSLLLIFTTIQQPIGAIFSGLLLLIAMHLRYSKSFMVMFNCLVGLVIVDMVSLIARFNVLKEKKKGGAIISPLSVEAQSVTTLGLNLLTLQISVVACYILILVSYMITLRTVRRLKMQHLWVYHNVIHWFNLFDMYYVATFGTLAFLLIFICINNSLLIIASSILFLTSFFIYYLKTKANVVGVFIQVLVLLCNLIIAAVSISKKIELPMQTRVQDNYQNLFIFFTFFTFLFLVLHCMYIYYIFANREGNVVRWLSERKTYYTNVHPYLVKNESGCVKEDKLQNHKQTEDAGTSDICFKYDRYVLYIDEEDKLTNIIKKEPKPIDINPNKYKYTDLHLYKHILLKTTYDMKLLLHTFYNDKSKSQHLESFKKDTILSIQDQPSESEVPSSYSEEMLKKQTLTKKYSKFLLQKVQTLQSQRSKDMNKTNFFNNRIFYFTNCKNTNYFTASLFYSKYTHILEILYDNYEELLFYLDRKMYFIHLLKRVEREPHILRPMSYEEALDLANHFNHYEEDSDEEEEPSSKKNLDHSSGFNRSSDHTTTHRSNGKSSFDATSEGTKSLDQRTHLSYAHACNHKNHENQIVRATESNQNKSSGLIPSESISQSAIDPLNFYTFNIQQTNQHKETPFKDSSENHTKYIMHSNDNNHYSNSFSDQIHYQRKFSSLSFSSSDSKKKEHSTHIQSRMIGSVHKNIEGALSGKEEKEKIEVPLFWYYNPGIISRVYQEWLKCKNIDYDKMNNDFYFLLSNSNQLMDYLKSNGSLPLDLDTLDEKESVLTNKHLVNTISNSLIRKNSNVSHLLLEDSNSSHSLNEIVSNFLQDSNGSFKGIQRFRSNSVQVQSFLEDKNIREFLSALCVNGISINQVGFTVSQCTTDKKEDETEEETELTNQCHSLTDQWDPSNQIIELKDKESVIDIKKMQEMEKKKVESFNNLGDIVEFSEFVMKDAKEEQKNHLKKVKESNTFNIWSSHETDIKSVCSYDDVLCDFIQNLEKEEEEGEENDNKDNEAKPMDLLKQKIDKMQQVDDSMNILPDKNIYKEEKKEKNPIIKDYLNNNKSDLKTTNTENDLLDSEEVYTIFKPKHTNLLTEPLSSFGSSEKESSLYSHEHPEWKKDSRLYYSNKRLPNEPSSQTKNWKYNEESFLPEEKNIQEPLNQQNQRRMDPDEGNDQTNKNQNKIEENPYLQSVKSVETFCIHSNNIKNGEEDANSIEDLDYIQWDSSRIQNKNQNEEKDSHEHLFDFTSNKLKEIEERNMPVDSSNDMIPSKNPSRMQPIEEITQQTKEENTIHKTVKDSETNTIPQEPINVNIFNEIILEKNMHIPNKKFSRSALESRKLHSDGIQLHSSKLKMSSNISSYPNYHNLEKMQNSTSSRKEDPVKNTNSHLIHPSIIVNPILIVPQNGNHRKIHNSEVINEKNQLKNTKLKTKQEEQETDRNHNVPSRIQKKEELSFNNESSKDVTKLEEKQNETYIQYIKELKKEDLSKEENIQINKADLTAIFRKNELHKEPSDHVDSVVNSNESKETTPIDNMKRIYHTNTNIFQDVFGFPNSKSDSSSLSSHVEQDAIAMMVGNDVFYESYVYQSLENLEKVKRVRNMKDPIYKEKESTHDNHAAINTKNPTEECTQKNHEHKVQMEPQLHISNAHSSKKVASRNIPSNNLNEDFISMFEKKKKVWKQKVELDKNEIKETEIETEKKSKSEINNTYKDNFEISLNGETFHITSNRMNDTQRFINYEIHQEERTNETKERNEGNEQKQEEHVNTINQKESSNKENSVPYHQTKSNEIKKVDLEEKLIKSEPIKNQSEPSNMVETPMPSSNAHDYLIHKNFYNEKSGPESENESDFSNGTSKEESVIKTEKESSFANHESSLESQELLSYENFLKNSNLSKLSDQCETNGLKKAYQQACKNLQKQHDTKTNSSSSSSALVPEENKTPQKEESLKETEEQKIKEVNHSMQSENESVSSKNQTKFLKYDGYGQYIKEEDKVKRNNRYYEESGEINLKKEDQTLNSNYHELMNRIVNSYSFNSQESYSEKQKFLSDLNNTHLRNNQPSELSDESDESQFAKNVLEMDSSSNLSSIRFNQIMKSKKKSKSKKSSKILNPRRTNSKFESSSKITKQTNAPKSNSFTKFMTRDILKNEMLKNNQHKFRYYTNARNSSNIIPSNDYSSQLNSEQILNWREEKMKQKQKQKNFNEYEYILNSSVPSSYPTEQSNLYNQQTKSNQWKKENPLNSGSFPTKFTSNGSIDGDIELIKQKIRRNLSVMHKRINRKEFMEGDDKKEISNELLIDSTTARKRSFSERKKPLMNSNIYKLWVNRVEGKILEEDRTPSNINEMNKIDPTNNSSAYVSFENESYKKMNSSEINVFNSQFSIESKYNDHQLNKKEKKRNEKKHLKTNESSNNINNRNKETKKESTYFNYSPHSLEHFCNVIDSEENV